jgi:hypothetical protein
MIADSRITKKVDSYIALQREVSRPEFMSEQELTFTLCDRTNDADKKANYFMSFNLPFESSQFPIDSNLSKTFPELQQLNVDKIIITPITSDKYEEFIDGKTIKMRVPVNGSSNPNLLSGVTVYGSTYSAEMALESESNILLGDNIVFLFSDDINMPYTGFTRNELGDAVDNSDQTTGWNPSSNPNSRPGAVSYVEVQDFYNTDQRTNINYAVSVPSGYPDNRLGYNYDIPVGFAVLDKGYIVLTHTAITENFPWTSGFTSDGSPYIEDFDTQSKTNIHFTGNSLNEPSQEGASLSFKSLDTSFKMTSVCIAMPQEFYLSNNPTWDKQKAIDAINNDETFANFDPVYITELGLYNTFGELIAVARLSEPVEKDYVNAITFEVNLEM